ncbi:MAG: GrpB family protein [Trueperaceae bacterium]|nr:GrpB family protein [Trueperaceae bacterium]
MRSAKGSSLLYYRTNHLVEVRMCLNSAMPIKIVPYKSTWPEEFKHFARQLRQAFGEDALAIHHIGSTSVPELAAKDIIDVQVTVADFSVLRDEKLGAIDLSWVDYIQRDHCPPGMVLEAVELEKRLYKKVLRPMNIHIRIAGRFNQRYALLCRDYLRSHPMASNAYAEIKRQLARYFPENVEAYYDIKDPVFDVIMSGAFDWAEMTSWQAPSSDA